MVKEQTSRAPTATATFVISPVLISVIVTKPAVVTVSLYNLDVAL